MQLKNLLKKYLAQTLLSDTIAQEVVKLENSEYASSMMPKLVGSGLKAMPFVIPENVFVQLSLKRFANNEKTEKVQYFKSAKEAISWLDKS